MLAWKRWYLLAVQYDVWQRDKPISLYRWVHIMGCVSRRVVLYSILSKTTFLCIFQIFQKLDSTKFISPTFHQEPWMKMSSCVTDVRRERFLICSSFLAPSKYLDASRQTVREARRLKMGTIWFSSDCEHNLTRTQRALQATSFASS